MSDNNDAHMKQSLDIHCVIAHKRIQGIVLTTLICIHVHCTENLYNT